MEIKRRLNKLAKRLSPQIEVMNVANEMRDLTSRLEELVTYAEEKIERSEERRRTGQKTIGQQIDDRRKAEQQVINDHQEKEAAENLRDQQEAFEERNRKPGQVVHSEKPTLTENPSVEEQLDRDGDRVFFSDIPDESRN